MVAEDGSFLMVGVGAALWIKVVFHLVKYLDILVSSMHQLSSSASLSWVDVVF